MGSSASTQKAINGKEWVNCLYFNIDGQWRSFEEHEVLEFFKNEEKCDEEIIVHSEIRKHDLWKWIPGWFGNWHEYTLVTTENKHTKDKSYWSFEKNQDGLHVHRSSDEYQVRRFLGNTERNKDKPEGRKTDVSNEESILKAFEWIINRSELNNTYHFFLQNSHFFASLLYEAITRTAGDRRLSRTYSICDIPQSGQWSSYVYFYKGNEDWIRIRSYQIKKYFVEELNADKEIIVSSKVFTDNKSCQLFTTTDQDSNTTTYWSVEFNVEGIFVQKSEKEDEVRCYSGEQKRDNNVDSMEDCDTSYKSIYDVMQVYIDRNGLFYVKDAYHIFAGILRRAIGS